MLSVQFIVIVLYFALTVAVGLLAARKSKTSDDFHGAEMGLFAIPENMLRVRDLEWPDALLSANLLIRYYNIFECRCQFEEKSIYFLKFR